MFDQNISKIEKNLETSSKCLSLLKNHFIECQDSFTIVMVDWDKSRVQFMQLGEKEIQLNSS
jgi:hypothetical protein